MKLALWEKGIPFEHHDAIQEFATIQKVNPRAEMPLIHDTENDAYVFESTVCMEYLEDKFHERSLLPKNVKERARQRMIEDLADSQLESINW